MQQNTRRSSGSKIKTSCLLIFIAAIGWMACRNKAADDHLPAELMGKVLVDLHTAEAYSTMTYTDSANGIQHQKNIDSLAFYYREILDHHKVSFDDFEKSMAWYSKNPALLDSIYTAIQPRLDSIVLRINNH